MTSQYKIFNGRTVTFLVFVQLTMLILAGTGCSRHSGSTDESEAAAAAEKPTDSNGGSTDHPNIILILADDLGYGDISAYNEHSQIPTPSLDSLAARGMRFTAAHSSSAVCTPSRYGILTGQYSWRTWLKKGVLEGYDKSLIDPDTPTIASFLKSNGYNTVAVGKWHLGFGSKAETEFLNPPDVRPTTLGFDEFYGIASSLDIPPYAFIKNGVFDERPTEKVEQKRGGDEIDGFWYWREGPIAPSFDFHTTDQVLTDKAVQYIAEQSNKTKPFFLYFALTAPHTPLVPRDEFINTSDAGVYGDFVAQMDASVSRVLDALEKSGESDNTIVIVTSDNGAVAYSYLQDHGHAPNGQWRGMKSQLFEGGHRIPLIVSWPGIFEVGVSERPVSLVDFFATFAELLEAPLESAASDSRSFADVLTAKGESLLPRRDFIVSHSLYGTFGIQHGDWKLIMDDESGGFGDSEIPEGGVFWHGEPLVHTRDQWQLYNLREDPEESRNLLTERPEVVDQLVGLLENIKDGK